MTVADLVKYTARQWFHQLKQNSIMACQAINDRSPKALMEYKEYFQRAAEFELGQYLFERFAPGGEATPEVGTYVEVRT